MIQQKWNSNLQNCINELLALPQEDCKSSTCLTGIYIYIHIYNIHHKEYITYWINDEKYCAC